MADRWRYYRTGEDVDPVRSYLATLSQADRSTVKARMNLVRNEPRTAQRTAGEIFEVQASRDGSGHRILFAREGAEGRVLLGLGAFAKIASRTPRHQVEIAKARLDDWRSRDNKLRAARDTSPRSPTRRSTPTRTLGLGR